MKYLKYIYFTIICLFSCNIVFAANEVVIKSITPIYDETSTVVVTEEENNHSVVFNDKNQNVKYNVVIENTTDKDLTIDNINLTNPSEDFLIYELEGLKSKDVLKANSTNEVIVSLSTISSLLNFSLSKSFFSILEKASITLIPLLPTNPKTLLIYFTIFKLVLSYIL